MPAPKRQTGVSSSAAARPDLPWEQAPSTPPLVGIDGQEHAAGQAMEVRIRGAHGSNRRPPCGQLLTFLNGIALDEVNELWAFMAVERK